MSNRVDNEPVVDGAGSSEPVGQTRRSFLAGITKALFIAPAAVALVGIETNPGTAQEQEEVTDEPGGGGDGRGGGGDRPGRRRKGGGKKRRRRKGGGKEGRRGRRGGKKRRRREREIAGSDRDNRGDRSCQPRVGQFFCRGRDR